MSFAGLTDQRAILFVVGKKYLVYANGKEILETDKRTGAKELDKASDDLKELGEGKEP